MIPPTGDTQPFAILISGATGSKYNQRERERVGEGVMKENETEVHIHTDLYIVKL